MVERRRRGVGTSRIAFTAPSRSEREQVSENGNRTDRQKLLRDFAAFVVEALPFLRARENSPTGTLKLAKSLCTEAICCLLSVSRNFLYNRNIIRDPSTATEEDLSCLIDDAGVRSLQHRRKGLRKNYPPIRSLPSFQCGCEIPCLSDVPKWILLREYSEFSKISRQLKPRHKENRYLLNTLFCPLSNTTLRVCNKSLSALYAVSEALIADIRRALNEMCSHPSKYDRSLLTNGSIRYNYSSKHPMNRYPDHIREKVERHLDFILRPDPAEYGGSICRVYSPEINTQEKLHKSLQRALDLDESFFCDLSGSTVHRMVNEYLKRRNIKDISFTQSDHNACPTCKTLEYAILTHFYDASMMEGELKQLKSATSPLIDSQKERLAFLSERMSTKRLQEHDCEEELRIHNGKDRRIRRTIKKVSDYFRQTENELRRKLLKMTDGERKEYESLPARWSSSLKRTCMTNQDDMTKVDLPHFAVEASSDITHWRFDVNAHVSAVTNDAVVFSHEQGTGPKNASAIIEGVLLDHLLTCKGEGVKIVVSDNAAVGKNWLTTIALPQYLVDQGLAKVVLVAYLENNHGKWLADMLFGQFQSHRRRTVILSVDDLLSDFEDIRRKSGRVRGFAVNPLGSVDFAEVFHSLGYGTRAHSDFCFVKRNGYFACACSAGEKENLPEELKRLLGPALPDDAGMVRVSTEPPGVKPQNTLRYEDRYLDVPAAHPSTSDRETNEEAQVTVRTQSTEKDAEASVPLVVPLDRAFSESGNGIVSHLTATHVDFNGFGFRKLKACAELKDTSSPLVRRTWPKDLAERCPDNENQVEPLLGNAKKKCAPLNWVVRQPIARFCASDLDWKARYPPRNLLNAKFKRGPREIEDWTPSATYFEPPFPSIPGTASSEAMKKVSEKYSNVKETLHLLHILRIVYEDMGDRDGVSDPWMQKSATRPSRECIDKYKNELRLYSEREIGHPRAAKSSRQFFKEDPKVLEEVQKIISEKLVTVSEEKKLRTHLLAKRFNIAEETPGALDRLEYLAEKDLERYSTEVKSFKEKQKEFDKLHGLLPVE